MVSHHDEPLRAAIHRMAETGLTRLPVVDRSQPPKLVGLVTLKEALRARLRHLEDARRDQLGLATLLGVSSRAVENWEQGLTNPKAEYLKQFIALCVRASAFAAGREEEQIRAFWRTAHQKVLLDEYWLQELLSQISPSPAKLAGEPSPATGQSNAVPSEQLALWTVPYARNPHFTGRDELLCQLEQQFARRSADQPTTIQHAALTQSQAIKGLGGIGKTQTAIEYAYRAREQGRYTHTLWIAAASEEAVLASFAALKEWMPALGQKEESDQRALTGKALRWLEQCPEPWLLIRAR